MKCHLKLHIDITLHYITSNFVEVLAPNILVQFLSLPYHDTSLHNSLSTCLRFVQLQTNLCHLLTGYIADVAETFKSLI